MLGIVALVLAGTTVAHAVDFKGVELGRSLMPHQERAAFGALDCNPMQLSPDEYEAFLLETRTLLPGARKVCVASASIATVPADATVVLGSSRRVLRLTFQFSGENYPLVVTAMAEKWGRGVAEVRDDRDESTWWEFEGGVSVSVHRVPGDSVSADTGFAEYALPVTSPAGDL